MRYRCEVYIRPRADILDPQGDAVLKALHNLSFNNVGRVRVGKYLVLSLEADDADAAKTQLDDMCAKLLANPITEDFEVEVSAE